MNLLKSGDFIADVERQFEWYAINAGWDVADRYLDTVAATTRLLEQHPQLGSRAGFTHQQLKEWRFFVVFRPFHKNVLFYEIATENVILRRVMHGHRDLPRRLIEPPNTP